MTLNEGGVEEHRGTGPSTSRTGPSTSDPIRVRRTTLLRAERSRSPHQLTDRKSKSVRPSVASQRAPESIHLLPA